MDPGSLGALVEEFTTHLMSLGHTRLTVTGYGDGARHFAEWLQGTLRVRGKGRREVRLPLPQDAGDALLDYLRQGRPGVDDDRIFLRSSAPYRPFAGPCAISDVVRLAVKRAGIADPPSRGTNLLRHSAAMLRAGATLDAIGTVLRHRSTDTTAHYAKVDVTMLQQIAQPWPGDASC
jgi:site-specific recombinase XerD